MICKLECIIFFVNWIVLDWTYLFIWFVIYICFIDFFNVIADFLCHFCVHFFPKRLVEFVNLFLILSYLIKCLTIDLLHISGLILKLYICFEYFYMSYLPLRQVKVSPFMQGSLKIKKKLNPISCTIFKCCNNL